jgi:hypothetical protein
LILSLHDLAVIAEIGERPSEFLLYLRRRTDSPVLSHYRALDELDLYMLFLRAELYVEEDPDEVGKKHASVPPSTNQQRKRFETSAVGTFVSDNCVELTLWMNRAALPEDEDEPSRPSISAVSELLELIDELRARGSGGWLRCGADLLALAGEAQLKVIAMIKACARATRKDGNYHDAMSSYAGLWGHASLFVASHGESATVAEATDRLMTYSKVKQYQIQADRAYGIVLDNSGALERSFYRNSVATSDRALDKLVESLRLQPVGEKARPIPPLRSTDD